MVEWKRAIEGELRLREDYAGLLGLVRILSFQIIQGDLLERPQFALHK